MLIPSESFQAGPLLPTLIVAMFSEKPQVNTEEYGLVGALPFPGVEIRLSL